MLDLSKPIKDRVSATHPTLGKIEALCFFEKVSRLCRFCGLLGHEMVGCQDFIRLSRLRYAPEQALRVNWEALMAPKFGAWVINSSCMPAGSGLHASASSAQPNFENPVPPEASHASRVGIKRGLDGLRFPTSLTAALSLGMPSSSAAQFNATDLSQVNSQPSSPTNKKPKPAGQNTPAQDI